MRWNEVEIFFSENVLSRNARDWNVVFESLPYQSFFYSNSYLNISLECEQLRNDWVQDLSIIFLYNSVPVGIWPISLCEVNGIRQISSLGMPVLAPVFIKTCPISYQKKMNKLCFLFAKKIAIDNKQTRWKSAESFSGSLGLSEWHWELSRNGAKTAIFHEGFIDLSLEMSEIKSRFRKSYKSLINWGLANWQSGILDIKGNFSVWEEFRNLHISVSGRETRSFKTWEMQYEDIKSGKSFLVWLRDKSSTLVGGGYFDVTRDEGLYDCGAYDRELFSMPLGHVVQFLAIQELKKRGCRFYKIGRLPHKYEEPTPTDKEISIGEFKKGFSLEIFPKYVYEIDTII